MQRRLRGMVFCGLTAIRLVIFTGSGNSTLYK